MEGAGEGRVDYSYVDLYGVAGAGQVASTLALILQA